ncbi:hypothetical protein [Brachyspira pulli]|uniref:hypothetical protein n=1 Tax=Brachyspira pulli TaxID=310721 RepID=UPI0030078F05
MAMEYKKAIEWLIMIAEMELDEGLEAKTSEMVAIWKEQGLKVNDNVSIFEKHGTLDSVPFIDCLNEAEQKIYKPILEYIRDSKIAKAMEANIK